MKTVWVIQKNIYAEPKVCSSIECICKKQGYIFYPIIVIPFADDFPDVCSNNPTIFYGATGFINKVYLNNKWNPGVFFDAENFTVKSYIEHYKDHMLNFPCEFTNIGKFASSQKFSEDLFFIRPNKDLKEFAGDVMEFNKLVCWADTLQHLPGCDNNPTVTIDTEIVVSEPVGISHEWRLFIINGQVSSGSHYRERGHLNVFRDVPLEVIEFVEEMCKIWTPSSVFVMDVAESANNLYVVECNCFNSAGFYESDLEKIMIDINNFINL